MTGPKRIGTEMKRAALGQALPPEEPGPTDVTAPGSATMTTPEVWGPRGPLKVRPPNLGGSDLPGSTKDQIVNGLITNTISNLAAMPLGSNGALGIQAFGNVYKNDDPLVANDPHRSVAASKPGNENKVWIHSGGVVDAGLALTHDTLAGKMPIGFGFGTRGVLEWSALTNENKGVAGAGGAVKALTIDAPVTSSNAKQMTQGEEFFVRGEGSAGVSVGATVFGSVIMGGPFPITAAVSTAAGTQVSGEYSLNVKKLEDEKVFVRVGKATEKSVGGQVSLTVGPAFSRGAIRQAFAPRHTGVVRDVLERNNYMAGDPRGANSNSTDAAKGNIVNALTDGNKIGAISEALTFQASIQKQLGSDTKQFAAFKLDLSTEEGKKAYDSLVRLDAGPATELAKQGLADAAAYEEHGTTKATRESIRLGPAKLFLRDTLRRSREGTLTVEDQKLEVKQELFQRRKSGLLGGTREVTWEGVSYEQKEGDPQTYFHLSFEKKDGATRKGEVEQFERFSKAMGAVSDGDEVKKGRGGIKKLFDGQYGNTTSKADIYFTRDGLKKLAEASEQEVLTAFAKASQQFEGSKAMPAWGDPVIADGAKQLIAAYQKRRMENSSDSSALLRMSSAYHKQYGRDITRDMADLEGAQLLAKHLGAMKGKPEQEWATVFADLGSSAKFDFWRQMAAMNQLAGRDETLVHGLSMQGDRLKLASRDEGMLDSADAVIGRVMSMS